MTLLGAASGRRGRNVLRRLAGGDGDRFVVVQSASGGPTVPKWALGIARPAARSDGGASGDVCREGGAAQSPVRDG